MPFYTIEKKKQKEKKLIMHVMIMRVFSSDVHVLY